MPDTTLHTYPTPVGEMVAVFTPQGLRMLEFIGQPRVDREMAQVDAAAGGPAVEGQNALTRQLGRELAEYFAGERRVFDIPLDLLGTPFQQKVWRALLEIPYGETWSYGQEAHHISHPTASRAVAAANGQNKVSIVVPCHRVIGSNGQLTGYGGGLPRKQFLLALEKECSQPQGQLWQSSGA